MAKDEKKVESSYGSQQIQVLEGLDPVRKRPGMYIGSTGPEGLHHLIWEIVDNCIGNAGMRRSLPCGSNRRLCRRRRRSRHPGHCIRCKIPALNPASPNPTPAATAAADISIGRSPWVGASVVNALSTHLKAEVKREGQLWIQEYKVGKPQGKVKAVGKAKGTGTTVSFKADDTIFTTTEYNPKVILDRMRQQAYLTKGIKMVFIDERDAKDVSTYCFYFEGGVQSYVRHLNRTKTPKHDSIFYVHRPVDGIDIEIGMQYVDDIRDAFSQQHLEPGSGTRRRFPPRLRAS
jgi:DNA gyrase subunit B